MREDTGCFQHARNLMVLVILLLGFGLGFGTDTAHARQDDDAATANSDDALYCMAAYASIARSDPADGRAAQARETAIKVYKDLTGEDDMTVAGKELAQEVDMDRLIKDGSVSLTEVRTTCDALFAGA